MTAYFAGRGGPSSFQRQYPSLPQTRFHLAVFPHPVATDRQGRRIGRFDLQQVSEVLSLVFVEITQPTLVKLLEKTNVSLTAGSFSRQRSYRSAR